MSEGVCLGQFIRTRETDVGSRLGMGKQRCIFWGFYVGAWLGVHGVRCFLVTRIHETEAKSSRSG